MILQEFLKTIDIDTVSDSYPLTYNEKEDEAPLRKRAFRRFREMLIGLEPKPSEDIMIAVPFIEDVDEEDLITVESCLFKMEDVKNMQIPDIDMPNKDDILHFSKEEADIWFDRMKKVNLPQSYAYEFSEWEDILGCQVWTGNMSKRETNEFAADILHEFSFNGMTRKSQDERRQELEESIRETEELMKLPKEERDQHFITHEELIDKLGWKDTRTQEEKDADMLHMYRHMIWNFTSKYTVLKRYADEQT